MRGVASARAGTRGWADLCVRGHGAAGKTLLVGGHGCWGTRDCWGSVAAWGHVAAGGPQLLGASRVSETAGVPWLLRLAQA